MNRIDRLNRIAPVRDPEKYDNQTYEIHKGRSDRIIVKVLS
ncbi:MAG: hypothetical protein V1792_08220 [Pseudomonadota bacterium]